MRLRTVAVTLALLFISGQAQIPPIVAVLNTASPVVSGMIVFIDTGSCPAGFTELSLGGQYLLLTTSTAGNAGTTGGSSSYTPAGTNSTPVFTGTPGQSTSAVSAGTPSGTNGATSTTGDCAPTNIAEGGRGGSLTGCKGSAPNIAVTAPTFTGSAMGTHSHTITASGTVSAPTFAGALATITPPFYRLIACKKN